VKGGGKEGQEKKKSVKENWRGRAYGVGDTSRRERTKDGRKNPMVTINKSRDIRDLEHSIFKKI